MHSAINGLTSVGQGGNFWTGAATGGLSSSTAIGAQSIGLGDAGMIAAGGVSGGLGSMITGGNFWTD